MKHTKSVTFFLLLIFFITQVFGLFLVQHEVQPTIIVDDNQTVVSLNNSLVGEVPAAFFDWKAILYLTFGIGFGTGLILLLRRFKFGGRFWKVWYFLAVYVAIKFCLMVIAGIFNYNSLLFDGLIVLISLSLALLKVLKQNVIIHNLTEILMYSGIGVFIVLLFNNKILWAVVLLGLISIYDMYAVWKSKHMITLAKFTVENKLFPGILINYDDKKVDMKQKKITAKSHKVSVRKTETKRAILGGGDVVFPLIFSGVVLGSLVNSGFSKLSSFFFVLIISVVTTFALYLLFYYGKKDRFYPAMPFISAGCLIGYGLMMLLIFLF